MKQKLALLRKLSEAFGPSTVEDKVIDIIQSELVRDYSFLKTPHKNLIAYRKQEKFDKTIIFQAHMDEVGFRPFRYLPNGFIELTPTGGVPRDVTNQMVVFHPAGVHGVLVISEVDRRPVYFVDIGAKDAKEALKMVPHHANGAYMEVLMEESATQIKGKSFDDRAGCAAIVSVLKDWPLTARNRVIGVFTAREETGNWPVTELYRVLMDHRLEPDLIVNVECCPGGPIPGELHALANIGDGIVLVNMDASYEPDPDICRFMETLAQDKKIHSQHMAVRDGSGELGRLALGFGVAGYPLTIPCRYMHYPHSVIAKNDYIACIRMIQEIAEIYH